MKKKLSKYGNSMALIIDKPILEILNITENTTLKISTDGVKITIEPIHKVSKSDQDKLIKKKSKEIMEKYSEAFKKLADN